MHKIIANLAGLFPTAKSMEDLDASDFKDNAGKIFQLVMEARKIVAEKEDMIFFQLAFDDHDSFYKASKDFVKKLINGERFGYSSVSEAIIEKCECADVQSDCDCWQLDVEDDKRSWEEIKETLRLEPWAKE